MPKTKKKCYICWKERGKMPSVQTPEKIVSNPIQKPLEVASTKSEIRTNNGTIKMFETYKTIEEEKSSDEDSIHLVLEADDEKETSSPDTKTTKSPIPTQNGETEDDILNKFDTINGTPELIDPKIEDTLLNDLEDTMDKDLTNGIIKSEEAQIIQVKSEVNQEATTKYDEETVELSKNDELSQNDKDTTESKKDIVMLDVTNEEKEQVEVDKDVNQGDKDVSEDGEDLEEDILKSEIDIAKCQEDVAKSKEDLVQSEKDIAENGEEIAKNDKEIAKNNKDIAENDEEIAKNNKDIAENDEDMVENVENMAEIDEDIAKNDKDITENDTDKPCNVKDISENEKDTAVIDKDIAESDNAAAVIDKDMSENDKNIPENYKDMIENDNNVTESDKDTHIVENDIVEDIDTNEKDLVDKNVPENDPISENDKNTTEEGKDNLESDNNLEMEITTKEPVEELAENPINDNKDNSTIPCEAANEENIKEKENLEEVFPKPSDNAPKTDVVAMETEEALQEASVTEENVEAPTLCEENHMEVDTQLTDANTTEENAKSSKPTEVLKSDEKQTPDKCENSNDSSHSQNLDSEDLLDISIIRDADEDNASAMAENASDNAANNEQHNSEKSDDNEDQDEGTSDRNDNDEIDMMDSLHIEKEQMEFEDEENNLDLLEASESEIIKESVDADADVEKNMQGSSESENATTVASAIQTEEAISESFSKIDENKTDEDKSDDADKEVETGLIAAKESGDAKHAEAETKSGKRSLPETEEELVSKKIKLSTSLDEKEETSDTSSESIATVKTLTSFANFMQDRKLKNKLTRSDLEQFVIQKICEVIMHKTVEGEMHQTIKKHEQTIEMLRKDVVQLTKQTRDLEIVNRKLMSELKAQNGNKKPLVPLKITRSVGLQVKLSTGTETTNVRKRSLTGPMQKVVPVTPNNRQLKTTPNIIRQVQSPQKPTNSSPIKTVTPPTPLLSQALQARRVTPPVAKRSTPIRPKPAGEGKPNASVIDLTDEDDKAARKAGGPPKPTYKTIPVNPSIKTLQLNAASLNKSIGQSKTITMSNNKTVQLKGNAASRTMSTLPQGVRLTPTQLKNGGITLPAGVMTSNAGGGPQLMYVVQPNSTMAQGIVTSGAGGTQKAVLVNFQPTTNGVLANALNGSAVSVLNKAGNTVQLKQMPPPRKHPAALPPPPVARSDPSLKPVPPKPHLSIRKTETGIILQWKMPYNLDMYENIASYQLYAYQETNAAPSTDMWRRVGDVKALALPMACTLTQFADKNKYYFAVRSVDVHKRIGQFSDPEEISL